MKHGGLTDLHNILAEYYRDYRGVMAPKNTHTEDIWALIEQVEAERTAKTRKQ